MKTPVRYSPELAAEICRRLSTGESLRAICRSEGMPDESSVRQWVIDNQQNFAPQYARARDLGLDAMADEVLEIADDGTNDYVERETRAGKAVVLDGEHVMRSRLRFEARRWYLSKMAPKRYGDRITQEISGADGGPVQLDDAAAAARIAAILEAGRRRRENENIA